MRQFATDLVPVFDPRIDKFGILRVSATIGRVGIQKYIEADGSVKRRLRRPEEVMRSADSFSHKPLTIDHPDAFVTADTASSSMKGFTTDVRYIDGLLKTNVVVAHSDAVQAALSTHRQVSCGYFHDLIDGGGVWTDDFGVMGEPGATYEYDDEQVNIEGNHVALVPLGRAGAIASLSLDAEDSIIKQPLKDNSMVSIIHENKVLTIDGQDAEKLAAILDSLKEQNAQLIADKNESVSVLTTARESLDSANQKAEEMQAQIDSLQGKVDALDASPKPANDSDAIASEVSARLAIWKEVGDKVAFDAAMSVSDIRRAFVADAKPELAEKLATASDEYVLGVYTVVASMTADSTKPLANALNAQDSNPAPKASDNVLKALRAAEAAKSFKNK